MVEKFRDSSYYPDHQSLILRDSQALDLGVVSLVRGGHCPAPDKREYYKITSYEDLKNGHLVSQMFVRALTPITAVSPVTR